MKLFSTKKNSSRTYRSHAASFSRRKRTSHRKQFVAEVLVVCLVALSMFTVAMAATINNNEQPAEVATYEHEITPIDAISNSPVSVSRLSSIAAINKIDTIIEKEVGVESEPQGITTTRLGVTVTDYDESVDYTSLINETYTLVENTDDPAVKEQLFGLLEIYETQRNLKVEDYHSQSLYPEYVISNIFIADNDAEEIDEIMNPTPPSHYEYTQEELEKLAAIVYAEAGASWCTDEHQRAVASVVMNRVDDPRFPDTIHEVVYSPGQYPNTCDNTYYDTRALANAEYVLQNGPTVDETAVFQANFKQGTQVVATFDYRDDGHSITYICA